MSKLQNTTIYLSRDSAALAVGANRVAAAVLENAQIRGISVELIRTSSYGMFWLEPLVEIATPAGRVAFGPVTTADVALIFEQGLAGATQHPC